MNLDDFKSVDFYLLLLLIIAFIYQVFIFIITIP
nr:MAG TPA: hypothetical protein [Caudoviricetes sp.]